DGARGVPTRGGGPVRASEIAALLGSSLEGGEDPEITGVAPLDRAGPQDLSFLANARYLPYVAHARAGVILVSASLADRVGGLPARIVAGDVHGALAKLLPVLYPEDPTPEPGVHPTAVVAHDAVLRIGAHVVIGARCELGAEVVLHPHVTLYPGVRIGDRSIVHSGVRVGVDGFGYAQVDGVIRKIPQVGGCIIGADVEIGANSTIDRGSIGATEIGD